MEKDTSKIVSVNLTKLRKQKKLTQLELANRFNFSDKTISKWESGESLPNIDMLCKLAEFYDVTLNDLANPDFEVEKQREKDEGFSNKIAIASLAVSIIWFVVTIIFVYVKILTGYSIWTLFVWAVPFSAILSLIFNAIWGTRKAKFILLSVFLWTLLIALYLQTITYNIWPVFILGVPSQITIVLWSRLKPKNKKKSHWLNWTNLSQKFLKILKSIILKVIGFFWFLLFFPKINIFFKSSIK